MIWILALLNDVNVSRDTVVPQNTDFWNYSSCILTAGSEVLAFYLSSGLGGGLPILIGTTAGAAGCVIYSYTAYTITPIKEMKPKAFDSAFKGGTMGIFAGLGLVILLKFSGLM